MEMRSGRASRGERPLCVPNRRACRDGSERREITRPRSSAPFHRLGRPSNAGVSAAEASACSVIFSRNSARGVARTARVGRRGYRGRPHQGRASESFTTCTSRRSRVVGARTTRYRRLRCQRRTTIRCARKPIFALTRPKARRAGAHRLARTAAPAARKAAIFWLGQLGDRAVDVYAGCSAYDSSRQQQECVVQRVRPRRDPKATHEIQTAERQSAQHAKHE